MQQIKRTDSSQKREKTELRSIISSLSSVKIEKMADLLGESPNHIDDLLKDLENWEAILTSLPDFGVDQNQDEMEQPALAID